MKIKNYNKATSARFQAAGEMSQGVFATMLCQTMCHDCAFHIKVQGVTECIHPDEMGVNCSTVIFCNSFQLAQPVDSPCVSFGNEEE